MYRNEKRTLSCFSSQKSSQKFSIELGPLTVLGRPGFPGDPGLLGRVLLLLKEPGQLILAPAPVQVHPDPPAGVELDARVGLLGLQAVEGAGHEVGQHARPACQFNRLEKWLEIVVKDFLKMPYV